MSDFQIERDLNIDNSIIRIQALSRLTKAIEDAIPVGKIISQRFNSVNGIEQLWKCCCHSSLFVCDASCRIWLHFIKNDLVEYSYVVNGFISRILSADLESSFRLLKSLKDVLSLQLSLKDKSLFQLNSPVHPFIIILQQRRELSECVLQQLKLILHNYNFEIGNLLILPVLKFILWKSPQSSTFHEMRLSLVNELWDSRQTSDDILLKNFSWKSLFWLNGDSVTYAVESQQEICQWTKRFIRSASDLDTTEIEDVLVCLASLAKKINDLEVDSSGCVSFILMLSKRLENVSANATSDTTLIILTQMLTDVPESLVSTISQSCEILASRQGTNLFVIGMLLANVVILINVCGQAKRFDIGNSTTSVVLRLFNKLESLIEIQNSRKHDPLITDKYGLYKAINFNDVSLLGFQTMRLFNSFTQSHGEIMTWLDWTINCNSDDVKTYDFLQYLTSAILLNPSFKYELLERCVELLVVIAKQDVDKASNIFVVILYKMKMVKDSSTRLLLCRTLPRLATTKVCVAPILTALLSFHNNPLMKAMAIRLMTTLWQQQERVYPILHKLLVEESVHKLRQGSTEIDEVNLARAASILDICRLKSHLHGSDWLTLLSKLVMSSSSHVDTPITVLSLESILLLCQEDVIDLKTTWKFLFSSLKMDVRSPVLAKLCELLSVSSGTGFNDENFITESVSILWSYGQADHKVASTAFKCLAKFNKNQHQLKYFPQKISEKITSTRKTTVKEVSEEVVDHVPGSCYVDMLITLPANVIPSFGELMSSLVFQEVRDMPRYLLYLSQTKVTHGKSKEEMAVQSVSKFLVDKWESNYLSNIDHSLTVGLLFAFDFQSKNVSNEEKRSKHFIISKGKKYLENFERFLMKEISFNAYDWRKMLIYSSAWGTFMERLYLSMVEARESQIYLNQGVDEMSNTDDLKEESSLWTRERISEILKNNVRVNPNAQGNAMIALAGLSRAIYKYTLMSGTNHRDGSKYVSHKAWMSEVATVIFKCLESRSDFISGTFTWCYPGSGTIGETIRTYMVLAVPLLSYTLIGSEQHLTENFLNCLQNSLIDASGSTLKNFSYGLSLGQLLFNLITEYSSEKYLIKNSVLELKKYCFQDENLDSRLGGILGLCIATSAMCREPYDIAQSFVESVLSCLESWLNKKLSSPSLTEILKIGLTIVVICATSSQMISDERMLHMFDKWNAQPIEHLNNCGDTISYGLLIRYLISNNAKYIEIKDTLVVEWTRIIENADNSLKLAALHGIFSLNNSCFENSYIYKTIPSKFDDIEVLITLLSRLATTSTLATIQDCSVWMLGCAYFQLSQTLGATDDGPTDYSFLDECSVLKAVVNCLRNIIKNGIHGNEDELTVNVCLNCLALKTSQPYPALNWSSLLSPLLNLSPEIQLVCIEVALARAPRSLSAKRFMTSLVNYPVFAALNILSRCFVIDELQKIAKIVNANSLQLLLSKIIAAEFSSHFGNVDIHLLKGLHRAILDTDHPPNILQTLQLSLCEIFHFIEPDMHTLWSHYCDTSLSLPDDLLEEIVSNSTNDSEVIKLTKFQCELVGRGRFPLSWLNKCIETFSCWNLNERKFNIYKDFLSCFRAVTKHCKESDRISWLLELMGYIQLVAQSEPEFSYSIHKSKVINNLFNIFVCAILSWADAQYQVFYNSIDIDFGDFQLICQTLSIGLQDLSTRDLWNSQYRKVTEWLIFLFKCDVTDKCFKNGIKECLFNLRHCDEFKANSTWVRLLEVVEE